MGGRVSGVLNIRLGSLKEMTFTTCTISSAHAERQGMEESFNRSAELFNTALDRTHNTTGTQQKQQLRGTL